MTVEEATERIYSLNVGLIGTGEDRHERPHKPLFLLAIFDLLDEGLAVPERIEWSRALRERFTAWFERVKMLNDRNTPDNPFRYLKSAGFWQTYRDRPAGQPVPFTENPLVRDDGEVFGRFTDGFEVLAREAVTRDQLRRSILARYFPHLKDVDLWEEATEEDGLAAMEERAEYGRSAAFRRTILDVYDHQCAACGLRIRLPVIPVSFVDAAHLIPFSESHNDHPTNGIALCKNHHWAMDRHLLAPGDDFRWHISPALDGRRSNGEEAMIQLENEKVLLPQDRAFYPDSESLQWRMENLLS